MTPFLAELMGTMLLVLLGDSVVANVVLKKTKGSGSGWIVITTGWALANVVAVYSCIAYSGAHLNPAVTLGLASIGKFDWRCPLLHPCPNAGRFRGGRTDVAGVSPTLGRNPRPG